MRWCLESVSDFQKKRIFKTLEKDFGLPIKFYNDVIIDNQKCWVEIVIKFTDVKVIPPTEHVILLTDDGEPIIETKKAHPIRSFLNNDSYQCFIGAKINIGISFFHKEDNKLFKNFTIQTPFTDLFILPVIIGSDLCTLCENLSNFEPGDIQRLIRTIVPSSSNFLGWLYGFQDDTRWKLIEGLVGDIGNIIRWGQSYDQLKIISIRRNLLTFFTEKTGSKSILYCIIFAVNIESSIQSKGLRFFIEDNMIFMELMSDPLLSEIKIPIYTILMSLNILTLQDVINLFNDVKSYDYMQPFFEKWPKYPSMIQETKKLWEEVTKNEQLAAIYDRYDLFERIIRQSFINVLSEIDNEKIKCEMFALVVKEMLRRNKILQSPLEIKKKRILTQTQRSDFHNCILNGPGEIQNQRTISVASGLIRKLRSSVYIRLTEIEKKEDFIEEEFRNNILHDTLRATERTVYTSG